ncbi:hypothetical protein EYC80_003320 [Monilinia laxa]|uniref:DUF7707 domain-containing protein n=1 Tax=Monilinia laxa TaxID=61186 RepID=A0A5N6KDG4_MONLA|nr:hypothetical protein EYC80_003320 [Monilinia laxa]
MRIVQVLAIVAQCAMMVKALLGSCNPQVEPSAVNLALRSKWCAGQIKTCGTLCTGDYDANICDPYSLCYECICSSNSSSPALQYYTQTMPTFQCEFAYQSCIASNSNDAAAQKKCLETEEDNCGQIDPDTVNIFTVSAIYSSSNPYSNEPYRISASTLNPTIEQITSTKTVTPTPTSTTTVWSTSTAGVDGNGTSGTGSGSGSGNFSTLSGIAHVSTCGATSALPRITNARTSSTPTGGLVNPSTVSASGAERIGAVNGISSLVVGIKVDIKIGYSKLCLMS